jgi:flagellar basal-body rod protein FlgG
VTSKEHGHDAFLWISKTGMEAQQTQLDHISHNLANVSTTATSAPRGQFEDLMYQNLRQVGANSTEQTQLPTGLQVGLGVRTVATSRSVCAGQPAADQQQPRRGDQGDGFFQITMPDGTTSYTRDGSFQLDARPDGHQQRLWRAARHHRAGQCAKEPSPIGADGTVTVTLPGRPRRRPIGQLQLASFINPAGLDPQGQQPVCRKPPASSGSPQHRRPRQQRLGALSQGFVETSNVNVVQELVTDDPDPARLRAELQGHPDLGPDAATPGAIVTRTLR